MTMFWGKGREVVAEIINFIQAILDCAMLFEDFFTRYLDGEAVEQLVDLVQHVRDAESHCDDVRHDIERQLFQGALMPAARGDIFNVLEAADKVPNKMESICDFVYLQSIAIPDQFKPDFKELISKTLECTKAMTEALKALFENVQEAKKLSIVVDEKESEVDDAERSLIKKIFDHDLELAYKMQLRELVKQVTTIADRAENAANQVEVVAIKRKA